VLQAWKPDTNGHTYQLFVSRGCASRIDAADRWRRNQLQTHEMIPRIGRIVQSGIIPESMREN